MSKEKQSKRGSPSVIARLMGLEGMPSRQDEHKVLKRKEESSQMKSHRSTASSCQTSSRNSSRDEQEFKDVYEVLDAPSRINGGNSLCGTSNRRTSSVDLIRQKFMDVKRLSTNEKFQDSKELNDALEVLDSNSDLFIKLLEQPDFLFTKHLHDLRGTTHQSHCHMLPVNASDTTDYNSNRRNQKQEQQILHKNDQLHSRKLKEFTSCDLHDKCTVHGHRKLPKFRCEEENRSAAETTRIIILKPKLGKSLNVARTASSPCSSYPSSSDCRNPESIGVKYHNASTRDLNREKQIWFSRHHSKKSREISREIIRQTRIHVKNDPMKFPNSRARGHAGDESSLEISTSDSGNDSDFPAVTSTERIMYNDQLRSSSCSAESVVSREAKKRLSERWKLTHRYPDMNIISESNTLGDMLAKSDREVKLENPYGSGECSSGYMHKIGAKFQKEPLGISRKGGCRDGCLSNSSRSKSLSAPYPAPSTDLRGPKTSTCPEIFKENKYMVSKEGTKMDRSNLTKGKSVEKHYSCSRNLRSCNKEAHRCSSSIDQNGNVSLEPCEGKRNFRSDEQSEENVSVYHSACSTTADTDSGPESTATDDGHSGKAISRLVVEPVSKNHTNFIFNGDVTSYQGLSDGLSTAELSRHQSTSELGSETSLKEPDQPSPVSILEAPYGDDLSSGSECFESLSADIHGLRMQLKLLKLESETYEEGPIMVSSDEDDEQSAQQPEAQLMLSSENNWELSYVADVLDSAGINDADPDTFMAVWYSADCPVNPKVFEELEKKYCDQFRYRTRCERKLMFDHVNSMLIEMHQEYSERLPWLKAGTRLVTKWNKQVFKDCLQKKLASSNTKKARENSYEMLEEERWLDWREEMDAIGTEIESMLINELIAELKI